LFVWGWSGTKFTITEAAYWPIVPALDGDDCGAISGISEWLEKPKCSEEIGLSAALSTTDPT
jgi:hypothetical protein